MLPSVIDPEAQNVILGLMSDATKDGQLFKESLRTKIAGSIAKLVKSQFVSNGPQSSPFSNSTLPEGPDFGGQIGKPPNEVCAPILVT